MYRNLYMYSVYHTQKNSFIKANFNDDVKLETTSAKQTYPVHKYHSQILFIVH